MRRYECVSLGLDRILLQKEELIPKHCILTDLPKTQQPVVNPRALKSISSEVLEPFIYEEPREQEVIGDRLMQIHEEARVLRRLSRPTPIGRSNG